MESLTLDANGTGPAVEDRALALLRDVWLHGGRGRGHEMLLATRVVLGSSRLGTPSVPGPLPADAVSAALAAGVEARARGGGGTTAPGQALLSRSPGALRMLRQRLRLGSVLVGGTNGKTTTAAMIASMLRASGLAVVHNRAGANLHWGVATALLEQHGDIGVFEVDEAWLALVAAELEPRAIVLGNLFRDRPDAYGELDAIAAAWAALAQRCADGSTTFVLDADDPAVASISDRDVCLYGIEDGRVGLMVEEHAFDASLCRRCGAALEYSRRFLSHLGHWACNSCGAVRPSPSVSAVRVDAAGLSGSRLTLGTPLGALDVRLPLPGLFNVYNALAAVAAAAVLDVPKRAIAEALTASVPAFGRGERIRVDGRAGELVILLMKNPAGANALVRLLAGERAPLHLWIALNDAVADGRDVSWIWDASFEPLAGAVERVTCSGSRAAELALRLKYAGWPAGSIAVDADIETSLDAGLAASRGLLVALPTYSALIELRSLLTSRGAAPPYWQ